MQSLTSFAYNMVFRLMPQDKPGQAHDYPAERAFNDRNPSRKPRGVTVKYLWLGGHSAEIIIRPTPPTQKRTICCGIVF